MTFTFCSSVIHRPGTEHHAESAPPVVFLLSSSFLADPKTHHHFIFRVYSIIWLKIWIWILFIQNNVIHKPMALLDNFSIRKLEANTFYLHLLSSHLSSSFSWSMTPHLVYKIKQGHKKYECGCTMYLIGYSILPEG